RKVTAFLDRLIERYGKPKRIRTDNGPEFTSKWFQLWLKQKGIAWSPIQKGSPQQNAIAERFNRTYREDVLDANLFVSLDHARELTEKWQWEYNHVREHESLNYQTRSAMLREQIFGNSFSFSLKKVWAILIEEAQNFFQCKSCLFAEVSNRSHAGKAFAKFNAVNYNYKLSKFSATFRSNLKKRKMFRNFSHSIVGKIM